MRGCGARAASGRRRDGRAVPGTGVTDGAVRRLISAGTWTRARHRRLRHRRHSRRPRSTPCTMPAVRRCWHVSLHPPSFRTSAQRGCWAFRFRRTAGPAGLCVTRRPPAPTNDPLLGDVHVVDYDDADVLMVGGVPVLAGHAWSSTAATSCRPSPPSLSPMPQSPAGLPPSPTALRRADTSASTERPAARAGRGAGRPAGGELVRVDLTMVAAGSGLPRPQLQVPFADVHGRIRARVDMLIGRVVGEADGALKYADPAAIFAEKQREDWLRDIHRVEVVRWVPAEMRAPQAAPRSPPASPAPGPAHADGRSPPPDTPQPDQLRSASADRPTPRRQTEPLPSGRSARHPWS